MLKPQEILDAALRKWPAALLAEATGETRFPLQIPFLRPRTTNDFDVLRQDIEALAGAPHSWRVDWEEVETRKWGRQRLPIRVAFDSIESLASALGRSGELAAFREALLETRQACPGLDPWLRAKAHRIVEYLADWRALVAVCSYFASHPRPLCYPRQIPVPLSTKFIEEHSGILRELLDVVVGDAVNIAAGTFAERFNLRVEPPQVRFRFLDPDLPARIGWPIADCSISLPVFAAFQWKISRVLVVENRDVFLCLPTIPETLAVFGSGKAASLLLSCRWMDTAKIVYWGDCDEAGYGILSNLRASFPHIQSLLMDETAWHTWKHLAVPGKKDGAVSLSYLTPSEQSALKAVLSGPWMLEQERIPVANAERAIATVFA